MRAHRFLLTVAVLLLGSAVALPAQTAAQTLTPSDPALDVPTGSDPALNVLIDRQGQALVRPTPLPPQRFTPPPVFTDVVPLTGFPPESLRLGEQGIVRSRFLVTETGETSGCSIEATSGYPRLDEAACAVVGRWTYKPGVDPISVTVHFVFHIPLPPDIPGDPALNVPDLRAVPQPAPGNASGRASPIVERFTPPVPITSHAVTVDDYPADSIRMYEQGTIGLVFLVNETGNVSECVVDLSSGYPRLDAAACAMVVGRWKYKPAILDGKTTTTLHTANVVYLLR